MTREEEIENYLQKIGKGIFNAFGFDLGFESGVEWADAHPHWISVEEELPKIGKDVLVLREDGEMQVAHQYNEEIARWWSVDGFPLKNNITHWMPLPSVEHLKKGGKK